MIKAVCSVRDSAAELYSPPMFVPSTGVAVRAFTDEVRREDPNNQLHKHPQDFVLFEVASFDDETGVFVNVTPARQLIRGVDVVIKE